MLTADTTFPQRRDFINKANVEHVELKGKVRAGEVMSFLDFPSVTRLTISAAAITGDKESVFAVARKDVVID